METFKIISIIFMMIVIYQIYQLNCVVFNEGFEGATQSIAGVDDTNAINTLAQIAKNLMAGGLTVPGNMNVTGDTKVTGALGVGTTLNVTSNTALGGNLNVTGNAILGGTLTTAVDKWNTSADGKNRTFYGNNGNTYYGSANGVHTFRTGANGVDPDGMTLDQNSNLTVGGNIKAQKICIGNTCITETHLKMISGQNPLSISMDWNGGRNLSVDGRGADDGNLARWGGTNEGNSKRLYIRPN